MPENTATVKHRLVSVNLAHSSPGAPMQLSAAVAAETVIGGVPYRAAPRQVAIVATNDAAMEARHPGFEAWAAQGAAFALAEANMQAKETADRLAAEAKAKADAEAKRKADTEAAKAEQEAKAALALAQAEKIKVEQAAIHARNDEAVAKRFTTGK